MERTGRRDRSGRRDRPRPPSAFARGVACLRYRLGFPVSSRRRARGAALARHRRIRVSLRRRRISPRNSLSRRIIAFNLIGLASLVTGVLYMQQFRSGLIDLRTQSLQVQGEIIAAAVAEASGIGPSGSRFDPVRANEVLRRLVAPTRLRAQIFNRGGRLTGDTRFLDRGDGRVEVRPLPPPGETFVEGLPTRFESAYERALRAFTGTPRPYRETPLDSDAEDEEVYGALRGGMAWWERLNSDGELIVSVAVPIKRFKVVLGALVLSTEGGDIDEIVQAERRQIFVIFLVAAAISLALSILLANTIAKPIRRLAEAAEAGGAQEARPINPERIHFPDLSARTDEIGYLSVALRRMTAALYERIDAIETFAADVAHEIKNPLTSLRSAVETMRIARTPDMRTRLLTVIEKDVNRLDRLVTDISNASRLDAELTREEMESFDIGELMRAIADMNGVEAAERGVRIEILDAPDGLQVKGLQGRIGQVMQNLVGNALSFSPKGGVVRIDSSIRASSVRVSIEDEGPGVPPGSLGTIFERFYSERPDHEEFGEHSGLGLSISKQIIEAHGGAIWAENLRPSSEDTGPTGARFTLELPL